MRGGLFRSGSRVRKAFSRRAESALGVCALSSALALAGCSGSGSGAPDAPPDPLAPPVAPSGVTVALDSNEPESALILEWNQIAGLKYLIRINNSTAFSDDPQAPERMSSGVGAYVEATIECSTVAPSKRRCSIRGLAEGVSHAIEVAAINDGGVGQATPSEPPTLMTALSAPSGIKIAQTDSESVTLEWDHIAAADGYEVYLNGLKTDCSELTASGAGKYRCRIGGLAAGSAFSIEVATLNQAAAGSRSSPITGVLDPPDPMVPDPPANARVALDETDAVRRIKIDWDKVDEARRYVIYIGGEKAFEDDPADPDQSTSGASGFESLDFQCADEQDLRRSCVASGLAGRTDYTFAIAAANDVGVGEAAATDPISITTASPAVPSDFSVALSENQRADSIEIEWALLDGASYAIYIDGSRAFLDDPSNAGSSTNGLSGFESLSFQCSNRDSVRFCLVSALSAGTKHQIAIAAIVGSAEGDRSDPISITTALSAPESIALSSATATSVTLEWTRIDGASGYKVYVDSTERACSDSTGGTDPVKFVCLIDSLEPDGRYSVEVSAVNDGLEGNASAPEEVSTSPTSLTGVTLALDPDNPESAIELGWNRLDGTETLIYIGEELVFVDDPSVSGPTAGIAPFDGLNFACSDSSGRRVCRISGLTEGTSYALSVSARKGGLEGAKSAAEPTSITTALRAPESIALSSATATSVTLEWTRIDGASGYKVYVDSTERACSDPTGGADPTKFLCLIDSLSPDSPYSVEVSALNGEIEGAKSSPLSARTAPGAPLGATLSRDSSNPESAIQLGWDRLDGTETLIYIDGGLAFVDDPSVSAPTAGIAPFDGLNFACSDLGGRRVCRISELTEGTFYTITISSRKGGLEGEQSASSPVSIMTALGAPQTITPGAVSATEITFEWIRIDGATDYKVYLDSTERACSDPIGGTDPTKFVCSIDALSPESSYSITVATVKDGVEGSESAPINMTTAPAAPTNVTVALDALNPESAIELAWDRIDGTETLIHIDGALAFVDDPTDGSVRSGVAPFDHLNFVCSDQGARRVCVASDIGEGVSYAISVSARKGGLTSERTAATPATITTSTTPDPTISLDPIEIYLIPMKTSYPITGQTSAVQEGEQISVTINGTDFAAYVTADGSWSAAAPAAAFSGLQAGQVNVSASVTNDKNKTATLPADSKLTLHIPLAEISAMRVHTPLSVGSASYSGAFVTLDAPSADALPRDLLFWYEPELADWEFKRDGNFDGDFDDPEDELITEGSLYSVDAANRVVTLKKELGVGLYRLTFRRGGLIEHRAFDIAPTLHVGPVATGSADGSSFDDPHGADTLQALIDAAFARAGEVGSFTPIIVKLMAGTYKPTDGSDRNISFAMRDLVRIYGGYSGAEEIFEPSEGGSLDMLQGAESALTIFSGDLNDDDDTVGFSENSYHIFKQFDETSVHAGALLSGVKIVGGNADGTEWVPASKVFESRGGAMMLQQSAPQVSNVLFEGNRAETGGAVVALNSAPTFESVIFKNNYATYRCGAFSITSLARPVTRASIFSGNSAPDRGGAVCVGLDAGAIFDSVLFTGNHSGEHGGALWVGVTSEPVDLDRTIFVGNRATINGGAIYVSSATAPLSATSSLFLENEADKHGGAISLHTDSLLTLISSSFAKNVADADAYELGAGNAILCDATSSIVAINTIFWDTHAKSTGATNSNRDGGIQLYNTDANALLAHNSIALDNPDAEALEFAGSGNLVIDGDGSSLFVDLADLDGADDEWLTADDGLNLISSATEAIDAGLYVRRLGADIYLSDDNSVWAQPGDATPTTLPDGTQNSTATDIAGYERVGRPDIGAYEASSTP